MFCNVRLIVSNLKYVFYLPLIFYVFRVTSGQWHPAIAHNLSQMHTLCQCMQWGSYLFLSSFHWGNLRLCIMHVSLVCCVSTLPWDCRETAGFGGGLCLGIFKYKKKCYLILRESWLKLNSTFWISLLLFYDTFFFFLTNCAVVCWWKLFHAGRQLLGSSRVSDKWSAHYSSCQQNDELLPIILKVNLGLKIWSHANV